MKNSGGYTLIELVVVTVVVTIIASFGLHAASKVIESAHLDATVEDMKVLAHAAHIAQSLPGGDAFTNVNTTLIAGLLDAHDINISGLSSTHNKQNHWGENYTVTTSTQLPKVTVTVPLENINPFGTKATPSGSSTILNLWHRPSTTNSQILNQSLANKRIMYQE